MSRPALVIYIKEMTTPSLLPVLTTHCFLRRDGKELYGRLVPMSVLSIIVKIGREPTTTEDMDETSKDCNFWLDRIDE